MSICQLVMATVLSGENGDSFLTCNAAIRETGSDQPQTTQQVAQSGGENKQKPNTTRTTTPKKRTRKPQSQVCPA